MQEALQRLQPQNVWTYFDRLLAIPHASGYEQQVAAWLYEFAQKHQLEVKQDQTGNVIIQKKGSPGKEQASTIILQAHLDMVAVKTKTSSHDFNLDSIQVVREGDFIHAKDTTLGADNGIGVSMILSILADPSLATPPLRAIFTVQEESTMAGAIGLDTDSLEAKYLINLDSEEDGQLYVSCAGSADLNLNFNYQPIEVQDCIALSLTISGLKGGHSGADIHLGFGNAIILMATLLDLIGDDYDFFLHSIEGGQARNAIPAECTAIINVPSEQLSQVKQQLQISFAQLQKVYAHSDPHLQLEISAAKVAKALGYAQTQDLLHLIAALPNGPLRQWDLDRQVVESSSNLGTIKTYADRIEICVMPRSLDEINLQLTISRICAVANLVEAIDYQIKNLHPCWSSPADNHLIEVLQHSYDKLYHKQYKITAMHAGLECAQFMQKNPQLEQISIGPTILQPHSVYEKVNINGVNEVYNTLIDALQRL